MKKGLIILTTVLFLLFNGTAAFAGNEITVFVDGEQVNYDTKPVIVDGKTMVPIRATLEALWYEIEWDKNTQTITALSGTTPSGFEIKVGSNVMKEFDLDLSNYDFETDTGAVKTYTTQHTLAAPVSIIDGRALLPLRTISEQLNRVVVWDGATRTITIDFKDDTSSNNTNDNSGNMPPKDYKYQDAEFIERMKVENNSKNFTVASALRSPAAYANGTVYRFSGIIQNIERTNGYTSGLLEVSGADRLVEFHYNGWLNYIPGDEILLYGCVEPNLTQYTVTNAYGTVYVVDTISVRVKKLQSDGDYTRGTTLTEDEWAYICGTYQTTDAVSELEETITITKNTINGRPYTIESVGYSFKGDAYQFAEAGEQLVVSFYTTNEYGDSVHAAFRFDWDNTMFYLADEGRYSSIYNYDFGTYVKQ